MPAPSPQLPRPCVAWPHPPPYTLFLLPFPLFAIVVLVLESVVLALGAFALTVPSLSPPLSSGLSVLTDRSGSGFSTYCSCCLKCLPLIYLTVSYNPGITSSGRPALMCPCATFPPPARDTVQCFFSIFPHHLMNLVIFYLSVFPNCEPLERRDFRSLFLQSLV